MSFIQIELYLYFLIVVFKAGFELLQIEIDLFFNYFIKRAINYKKILFIKKNSENFS